MRIHPGAAGAGALWTWYVNRGDMLVQRSLSLLQHRCFFPLCSRVNLSRVNLVLLHPKSAVTLHTEATPAAAS